MVCETNPEEIKHFPLQPIGCRPNAGNTVDAHLLRRCDLQTYTFIRLNGIEVIDNLKRRVLAIRKVDTGEVRKISERRLFVLSEKFANLDDLFSPNVDGKLANEFRG